MGSAEELQVCVAYALPQQQQLVQLRIPAGSTVRDAVTRSGLLQRFPAIGQQPLQCAIFSRVVAQDELLTNGDRVEILRPLLVDPKQQRREQAAKARAAAQLEKKAGKKAGT
jgi:putative ubiquitin-RnfH superfamily antitoxin RatB of RatAB toxin-antitoxin module